MANPDRTRKLLIRTAIVTTSTAATLFGAQNLAMLDSKDLQLTPTPSASTVMMVEAPTLASPVTQGLANIIIQQSAPSVTILRHSSQSTTTSNTTSVNRSSGVIQPPAPAQVSAPQPVIIQQPMQQVTQSSK